MAGKEERTSLDLGLREVDAVPVSPTFKPQTEYKPFILLITKNRASVGNNSNST